MSDSKNPTPDQLRRDVNAFLKEKYGDRVVIPPDPDLNGQTPPPETEKKGFNGLVNFNLKPTELEEYLRQFVVGSTAASGSVRKAGLTRTAS